MAAGRGGRGRVDPFEFFFGPRRRDRDNEPENDEEFRSDSGGSGFIVSADGYVVTNNHVIDDAEQVQVVMDGREFDAEMRALRLRSTRSLWDPDYTDEGWIGEDSDATDQQPDPIAAEEWYRRGFEATRAAADHGDIHAQYMLA